ncbi:hypothetical protein DUI87_04736 [Hirundo rustica rustica]|uniref:PH domain-containing protein n=1 Tax=Hirundo rustica rustica TaxID=333673 RepID=A0A3M0L732_HIRRU|nr:hypothetical protein DUI87_04736 [Hirundo rustica rustica]
MVSTKVYVTSLYFYCKTFKLPPISRHRRNLSQHNLTFADVISTQDPAVVEKEGYLLKAKIADGGKKLRKNWSTSWIVLTSRKMEFYKESKQPALANLWHQFKFAFGKPTNFSFKLNDSSRGLAKNRDINLSVWICVALALSGPQRNPAERMSFSHNFTLLTKFTFRKVSYEEFLEFCGWTIATDVA